MSRSVQRSTRHPSNDRSGPEDTSDAPNLFDRFRSFGGRGPGVSEVRRKPDDIHERCGSAGAHGFQRTAIAWIPDPLALPRNFSNYIISDPALIPVPIRKAMMAFPPRDRNKKCNDFFFGVF